MDDETDPYADLGMPAPDPELEAERPASLGDDLRQLIDDGRALAAAELAWQKSRAAYAGRQAGGIALLALLAAGLLFCALMALTFGLVLSLTDWLGAWGATGAVTGALLLAALICGAVAARRVKRAARVMTDRKAEP